MSFAMQSLWCRISALTCPVSALVFARGAVAKTQQPASYTNSDGLIFEDLSTTLAEARLHDACKLPSFQKPFDTTLPSTGSESCGSTSESDEVMDAESDFANEPPSLHDLVHSSFEQELSPWQTFFETFPWGKDPSARFCASERKWIPSGSNRFVTGGESYLGPVNCNGCDHAGEGTEHVLNGALRQAFVRSKGVTVRVVDVGESDIRSEGADALGRTLSWIPGRSVFELEFVYHDESGEISGYEVLRAESKESDEGGFQAFVESYVLPFVDAEVRENINCNFTESDATYFPGRRPRASSIPVLKRENFSHSGAAGDDNGRMCTRAVGFVQTLEE